MPAPAGLWLYLFDLADCAGELEQAQSELALLSGDETAPHAPHRPLTGERRLARIALRLALAAAGVGAAGGQPFARTARGKPVLPGGTRHFNVSHTPTHSLIAIAGSAPVGVDLEIVRPLRLGPHRTAQIVTAARGLGAALPADHDLSPLAAWTALEAHAKAEGGGIGTLLTVLGIMGTASRTRTPDEITARARDHRRNSPYELVPLDLGPNLQAFVCAPAADLAACPAVPPVTPARLTAAPVAPLLAAARATFRLTAPPAQGHKERGVGA